MDGRLPQDQEALIRELYDAVVGMNETRVKDLCTLAVASGFDGRQIVRSGMIAAMEKVGDLYTSEEYYVSELLLCADILRDGLAILAPIVAEDGTDERRQMIIGTVEGDIHDVGKNIVKIIFEATGWRVHDLGKDVPAAKFVEEQSKTNADIVALSALMSTTMIALPKAIQAIKSAHPAVPVIVGGAPLTREIALSFGADGYAADAGEAVTEARNIILPVRH